MANPALADVVLLKRFLCICDDLSGEIADCIDRLVRDGKGEQVINVLVEFSSVVSRKLIVSTLALCTTKDLKTKQAAYDALSKVCETPPLLFHFLAQVAKQNANGKSGFGRAKRKAIAKWYNSKSLKDLATFVTRYRRRSNWSHVDVVRLAHTKPGNPGIDFILKYITKGLAAAKENIKEEIPEDLQEVIKYLETVEKVKHSKDEQEVARLVQDFQLTLEHVPTWFIKGSKEVWSALVPNMLLTSILSHLNKMATIGLLDPGSKVSLDAFVRRLEMDDVIKDPALHPISIQMAMKSYESGKAGRSPSTWTPNPDVLKALHAVFCKTISLYEPTGSRYAVIVDINTSMFQVNGPLLMSPVWAAASLSLGILRKEIHRHLVAIGINAFHVDVSSQDVTVEQICENLEKLKSNNQTSNLARAVGWALDKREEVDLFIVFTNHFDLADLVKTFKTYRAELKHLTTRLVVALFGRMAELPHRYSCDDPGVLILKCLKLNLPEIVHHFALGKLESVE